MRELRTSKGTVSDLDGKFSMQVHKGQTLLFDYVGMKQKSILVGEDRFIKVELESSDNSLEEVVVTGYNQVNSRIFVGAAAKISTKDFAFSPQADFSRLLEGRAPGLNTLLFRVLLVWLLK
ncbi:carboxypeptidase-like regulatory domain-containing protein [uncultured Bacteroides sp.]|uniref:carboxypeptidase-like regulatory domain-containing protein n=1 Tax=uncultured Bacteroides sp. TaxID=162156 RepID=UPI002665D2A9|nr:carboxypeptidase-like regulatory domain-containing protein [uncultured Bacteroides sp.]